MFHFIFEVLPLVSSNGIVSAAFDVRTMKLILALMSIVLTSNAADTIPLLDTNGKTSKIKWNMIAQVATRDCLR
jgi:hypothetical protein